MSGVITSERDQEQDQDRATATAPAADLADVKPLPVWFFAFEGVCGAGYDLCQAWSGAWMVIAAFAAVNIVVGVTVLRRRMKLVRAMLKNSRTRKIAFGLIALRLGAHAVLGAVGAQVTSVAGHLAFATVMCGATVALLYVDQRIAFKALGLRTAPAA